MVPDHPETLRERKEALLYTMAELAKWPHHNDNPSHSHDFNRAMAYAVKKGRVPESVGREGRDDEMDFTTYTWQIFCSGFVEVVFMSEEELREWVLQQKKKDNPVTATDGSKGQWRAANQARIKLGEWLLDEIVTQANPGHPAEAA